MESIPSIQPIQEKQASSAPIRAFLEESNPKGGVSKQMVASFFNNLMKQFETIMKEAMTAAKKGSEDLKKAENITTT
ncbi:MAG: hypothetical protein K940chlam2_00221 [Chlamydiae bacterium]|nr:hypothetical protein [Chlamydiota bacterium]